VNVVVSSLIPSPPSTVPFARTSPNAEVIVAPKTRSRPSDHSGSQSRSITSAGRRSGGARSNSYKTRGQNRRDAAIQTAVFLRPVDKRFCGDWFDDDGVHLESPALAIWVDQDVLVDKALRGMEWVSVSIVQPAGLKAPLDPQQQQASKKSLDGNAGVLHAAKVVATILTWDDAPDARHVALSSTLCSSLGVSGLVGGLVRIEAAPPQVSKSAVRSLKVFPFAAGAQQQSAALKFGGDAEAKNQAATARLMSLYGSSGGILTGPLTDGLVLPKPENRDGMSAWQGGVIRFEVNNDDLSRHGLDKQRLFWILGSQLEVGYELQQEIPDPFQQNAGSIFEPETLPWGLAPMIGVGSLTDELLCDLSHSSSVLLTGGLGSGKTGMARLLGHRLRSSHIFHTSYFSCHKLVTDETRVSAIKETVKRLFLTASWAARSGGSALVMLDDLDKLCPAETELQVGNDNGRSRQVSELICSAVRQYCSAGSGVVLLATSQSKESVNNVIVGGHIVRKIVNLKAPNKAARKQILTALVGLHLGNEHATSGARQRSRSSSTGDGAAWMDGAPPESPGFSFATGGFAADRDLDLLDLAGQTDGYMPGDLVLLVSRARSEALIRCVEGSLDTADTSATQNKKDFQNALKGFTPATLRNVTLQSSKTSFDSIGGLHETRKVLLETLQYPTTYAPIFAQCPLRLRSGLLLYGYPGCGKTLLASAVAGECGLNFISVKGPEILNKYIGASEKSVRDLFERAESARPCVLFFDEFDSIAPKRGHDSTGVTDRVVNQLLTQMDGAEGLTGVYVLAATSRPDLIDPALLRPGRLDKSLICDLPDLEDRLDILRALSRKLNISPSVLAADNTCDESLLEVAHRTPGYSGADLQAVVYNAHLEAIHDLLGDQEAAVQTNGKKESDNWKPVRSAGHKDLIQFRFGENAALENGTASSKQLVDDAAIVAKLGGMKAARRHKRHLRHGDDLFQPPSSPGQRNNRIGNGVAHQKVVIDWRHLEASLATTRSSISIEERRRLEMIYREFTVGRNGEMPQGDGPREVGGRSSLM